MGKLFEENDGDIFLVDKKGKDVASMKICRSRLPVSLHISDWKSIEKGQGHGKEIMKKVVGSFPNLKLIETDGFTAQGKKHIQEALPKFKVISHTNTPFVGGTGLLKRVKK